MNKDDAREAARSGFTLPGEDPLDKVAFDCGYKAGAASVDRRAIVQEAFAERENEMIRLGEIAKEMKHKAAIQYFGDDFLKTPDKVRQFGHWSKGWDAGFDAGAASVDRGAVEVLRKTVEQYDGSDNGTCSVCRIGHRLYDLKGNIGICEWDECLSHEWRAVLARDGRGR